MVVEIFDLRQGNRIVGLTVRTNLDNSSPISPIINLVLLNSLTFEDNKGRQNIACSSDALND